MTHEDLPHIATLEIGGSRSPEGWIEWTRRNYEQYGFGLRLLEREVHVHGGAALIFGADLHAPADVPVRDYA